MIVGIVEPGARAELTQVNVNLYCGVVDARVRERDALAGPAQVLIDAFEERFKTTPDLFRAPGRVNLIGEHTDYNFGFVLPIAIDLACYAASAPNRDGVFRVYSLNYSEGREWPVDRSPHRCNLAGDWTDYVIGVARQIPRDARPRI